MSTKKQKSVEEKLQDAIDDLECRQYDIEDLMQEIVDAQDELNDVQADFEAVEASVLKRLNEILAKKK
jgi:FtsZ-binding cell division protein ZapB